MIIQDLINNIEEYAPLSYAEDFDNVGLLVGDAQAELKGILITLDTLEAVVEEAIEKDCNFILSFHPIVFSGLKKINGSNYVERTVLKAIKNDIAIYAIHTALDNHFEGVNAKICQRLGLKNRSALILQKGTIKKLTTFVPTADAEKLRQALFEAGAGSIGNYDNCSFNVEGKGSFKGNENSNPVIGTKGVTHYEPETQIGVTYSKHSEGKILKALFKTHPYEEVAYEITKLENLNQHIGIGMIGELETPLEEVTFLNELKKKMNTECIRHSKLLGNKIKKVAVLGGSGAFGIEAAKKHGADIYITGDVKYHDFFRAEDKIIIADIGHYETEQYTKNLLFEYLTEKIPNFAPALPLGKIIISDCNTNPVKYF
ncbi:Nif3-like dinuclear metal center hexameric protein [Zhouia amylolytica]|uniref:GTP cyclohydrolase 1 type 2 homolog n=1 Tax=Zhouia amylolytica AD3 TaxID=1286632 RepID=W2US62_9FLAO|nr:Nif3-like dinuclear metal center hexameric protein [Zhouia amylolytica]ETN96833.1 dinuclear metal center protein, YbgI/SA1388 family [Zhouia amylolytica AD3]